VIWSVTVFSKQNTSTWTSLPPGNKVESLIVELNTVWGCGIMLASWCSSNHSNPRHILHRHFSKLLCNKSDRSETLQQVLGDKYDRTNIHNL